MIRNKKKVILIFFVLFIMILFISIGFATVQQSFTLTMGRTTQNSLKWNVGLSSGTINGIKKSSDDKNVCKDATATSSSVSGVEVHFYSTGERCRYNLSISNTGDINAKISNISFVKPSYSSCTISGSTMTCGDVTYSLKYSSSNEKLKVGDVIPKKNFTNIYLDVEYTGSVASSSDFEQNGYSVTITYSQN